MNLRLLLILLVLVVVGMLILLGAVSVVRWLRLAYPRYFRAILACLLILGVGLGVWGYSEIRDRPAFHPNDLITLGEPLVGRVASAERNRPTTSCIVELREHLSVVNVDGGMLTARVESNSQAGPSFCPVGAQVQFDPAWLRDFSLTHRH